MNSNNTIKHRKLAISGKLKEIGTTIALMNEGIFTDARNYEIFHEVNEVLLKMVKDASSKENSAVLEPHQYDIIKKIGLREFMDKFTREVVDMSLKENNNKPSLSIKELKIGSATFYRYLNKEMPETSGPMSKVKELEHEF